jgi:peptide/nickel transport system substrate-binding protein
MTKSWQRGVNIQWVKNPLYRGGWKENQFEEVNLRMIYEAETQRVMIEKGDLDIAQNISLDTLPALKNKKDVVIHENVGTARNFIVMNAAAGPTKDVRVRKAISHLWNHDTYSALRRGLAPRSEGPSPAIVMGADYRPNLVYRYDPERARKLLAEAGYPQGGFTLTFLLQKGDEPKRTQFEVLQSDLKKVGIRMNLAEETWPAINKRLADWGTTKDATTAVHFVGYWRVVTTFTAADYLFWMYHADASINKGGRNLVYYSNPEVDRLIDLAISSANRDEEQKLWRRVNEMVFDDAPALFIEKLTDWVVTRAEIAGYLYRGDRLNNLYYRMSRR